MKVAYIMSRFPHLPETFIIREMVALENEGIQIALYPIIFQREKVIHPVEHQWLNRIKRSSIMSPSVWRANSRLFYVDYKKYLGFFNQVLMADKDNRKFSIRNLVIFPNAVWMAESMIREGIDHIHVHYAIHPVLAAYIVNQLTNIPYSVSVHANDIYADQTIICEILGSAEFIRSISDFNKKFLINHCSSATAQKIQTIHYGIDPKNYQKIKTKRRGKFRILSIGSLQPNKGFEYLIKACALLKRRNFNFTCEIIGGGELLSELKKMIVDLDLEKNVRLLGRKTETEVSEHMHLANCYVLPSIITESDKMEEIPVALMEAMACKLPVIATKISGIPELVEDQRTGFLVPATDEVALAERIFWIFENPKDAIELGKHGYKKIRKEFNLNKIAPQLKELFLQYSKTIAGD